MYNAPQPRPEDLPSKAQLFRSSIMAAIGAAVILVTSICLPNMPSTRPVWAVFLA